MKISNDFSYIVNNERVDQFKELGVYHLRFDTKNRKDSEAIMDLLEENFKVYQYKNSTRERYLERELFFWSNESITGILNYFTISFNIKSISKNYKDIDKLLFLLMDNLVDLDFKVSIQYTKVFSAEKISTYIEECDFNINSLDIQAIGLIEKNLYSNRSFKLHEEFEKKLDNLILFIKRSLEGKRIIFNGMKGTLKHIEGNEYGFFKLRAKTRYYSLDLSNVNSITV